jgi:NAD(P)H-hydrate epimerase
MKTVTKAIIKKIYPKRNPWCRKGDFGKLLVIAGNNTYTGSPALVSLAALKSGTDWVDVFSPQRASDISAGFSPDIITHPQKGDFLNLWHLKQAVSLEKRDNAIVIGNGLGRRKETEKFIIEFLKKTKKPCVVDADAIKAIAQKEFVIKKNFVLTPHSYEFFLLTDKQPTDNIKQRQGLVQRFAKKLGCVILLKGHIDIISDGKNIAVNKTGHPCMSAAGTGDVLAGICGALLARGEEPFKAACSAAYINGKAGELAANKFGESLTAQDVVNDIYRALKG